MVCTESKSKIHILAADVFTGRERARNKQTHMEMVSSKFSKPWGYMLSMLHCSSVSKDHNPLWTRQKVCFKNRKWKMWTKRISKHILWTGHRVIGAYHRKFKINAKGGHPPMETINKTALHALKNPFWINWPSSSLTKSSSAFITENGATNLWKQNLQVHFSLQIDLQEKEVVRNTWLFHVARLSNNPSKTSMTDHEKKHVGKTQAGGSQELSHRPHKGICPHAFVHWTASSHFTQNILVCW